MAALITEDLMRAAGAENENREHLEGARGSRLDVLVGGGDITYSRGFPRQILRLRWSRALRRALHGARAYSGLNPWR